MPKYMPAIPGDPSNPGFIKSIMERIFRWCAIVCNMPFFLLVRPYKGLEAFRERNYTLNCPVFVLGSVRVFIFQLKSSHRIRRISPILAPV